MAGWKTTVLEYIGKGLAALFAGGTAAIGSTIAVLAQIGEGAAFSDIELIAGLSILATGLADFGTGLGSNARQSS